MLLKNILAYSGVHLFSQVLSFVQNIIVRALLAPPVMGIWNYVGVVQGFLGTFDLGINAAALRELPLLRGQGRPEEEARARATAFWSSLAQGLLIMALILGYLVCGWQSLEYKISLLVAALLMVTNSLKDSLITFLQGAQQYIPLTRVQFLTVILQASALCLGAYFGGIYGLMLGAVLVQFCLAAMLLKTCLGQGLRVRYPWNLKIFKRQVGFGLPFRVVDYPLSLLSMLDVLVVSKFMNIGALAIYTTARLIVFSIVEVLSRMSMVIVTRLNELGATEIGRKQISQELCIFLLVEYLLLLPILGCLGFFAGSFLLFRFIPQYASAIPVLKILLLVIFFVPQTSLVRNFWILDKRLGSLGIASVVGLVGFVGTLIVVMKIHGLNLVSVAWASVGGYLIYYFYLMVFVGREVWGSAIVLGLCTAVVIASSYTLFVVSFVQLSNLEASLLLAFVGVLIAIGKGLLLLSPLFVLACWQLWRSNYFPVIRTLFKFIAIF